MPLPSTGLEFPEVRDNILSVYVISASAMPANVYTQQMSEECVIDTKIIDSSLPFLLTKNCLGLLASLQLDPLCSILPKSLRFQERTKLERQKEKTE